MGNPDGVARPKARRLRRAFPFAQAVPDEPDPPRKNYGFKDRDFKRDNALKSTEPPPPTAKELAIMSGPVANHGKAAVGSAKVEDPNDVYAVLQENRTVEKKHGLSEVEIREIKSRRKRDYWLLLIGGNLAIVGAVALSGFNIVSVIFGLSGLIVFSIGTTWIMWQVMNKY